MSRLPSYDATEGELSAEARQIHWALRSQHHVGEIVGAEIARRRAQVGTSLARKGDVLIFHACLLHRAELAKDPNRLRKTIVTHYSGIKHRPDFANLLTHGRKYLWLDMPLNA